MRKLFLVVALAFLVAGVAAASDLWDAESQSMQAGQSIFLSSGYRIDLLSVNDKGVKVQVFDASSTVLGSTQVAFGTVNVAKWCIEAVVSATETAGVVKAKARATCNLKSFTQVSGTGWLRASAETGSIQISDATGTLTIHGQGSITIKGDALTRGYGYGYKRNTDNSVTYSGDGMVVVKGSNLYISSTATNVDLYAQGTGSVKLTGKGEYKAGTRGSASYAISSTGGSVTLSGKGWLKAAGTGFVSVDNGNGVFVITGSGWIRVKDSAGDSTRVVAGFGSVKKEADGSITYAGFGTVFVKGTGLKLEASGSDVDLYAKGSGKVFMKGVGFYEASGIVPLKPVSVSPSPTVRATTPAATPSVTVLPTATPTTNPVICTALENEFAFEQSMHINDKVTDSANNIQVTLLDISGVGLGAVAKIKTTFEATLNPGTSGAQTVVVILSEGQEKTVNYANGIGVKIKVCQATTGQAGASNVMARFARIGGSTSSSLKSFEIPMAKGWNLLSSPVKVVGVEFKAMRDGVDCTKAVTQAPRTYSNGQYASKKGSVVIGLQNIEAGKGYWVKANLEQCKLVLNYYEAFNFETPVSLTKGWNLVGGPFKTLDVNDVKGNCLIERGPYAYVPLSAKNPFVQTELLVGGQGYWVKVAKACIAGNVPWTDGGIPVSPSD